MSHVPVPSQELWSYVYLCLVFCYMYIFGNIPVRAVLFCTLTIFKAIQSFLQGVVFPACCPQALLIIPVFFFLWLACSLSNIYPIYFYFHSYPHCLVTFVIDNLRTLYFLIFDYTIIAQFLQANSYPTYLVNLWMFWVTFILLRGLMYNV